MTQVERSEAVKLAREILEMAESGSMGMVETLSEVERTARALLALLESGDGDGWRDAVRRWERVAGAFVAAHNRAEPAILSVFMLAKIHGHTYTGPSYEEEFEALRALLPTSPSSGEPE